MEEWYLGLLDNLEEYGEESFTEAVEDSLFMSEAYLIKKATSDMQKWRNFNLIYNIFKNTYDW